jgi:hypothetical protein
MTIDVRAKMICNLGRVVEGSISDDLLQDSGLVRVTGELTISGVKSFTRGTRIELAYKQEQFGTVTRFPRPLRVLKSTADPYRNKTMVEVGCKLALMESRKVADVFKAAEHPPDWWRGTVTPLWPVIPARGYSLRSSSGGGGYASANPGGFPEDATPENYLVSWPPPPVSAQKLLEYCLDRIGIKLASNSSELTFYFSRKDVDLSGGYVSVISDLLKSHCMFGRLNAKERLVAKPIKIAAPEPGPTLRDSDLIDLEPIAGGDDPADTVLVSYDAITRKGKRNK